MAPAARFLRQVLAAVLVCWVSFAAQAGEAQPPARRWGADYFPNVALTDHNGRSVRFYDDVLRGKVVIVNFIFTTCTDVCPAETAQLRQVYDLLGERVGRDVHMVSISIDPTNDTPAALKAYKENFQIADGWSFYVGAKSDTDLIQRRLGLRPADPGDLDTHSTSIILGNEAMGRWIKRSPFDTPLVLANLVTESLMLTGGQPSGGRQDYGQAIAFGDMPRGEYLFRTRCASCHTLGRGDRIGPDLLGVASSRDTAWLSRMIREPDALIASGDHDAKLLVERFRGVRMPNLGLNEIDAAALIAFLKAEDELAIRSRERVANPNRGGHDHGAHKKPAGGR